MSDFYYAGIGSRETPQDICALETKIAARMEELGFILRSGGAKGSDAAFEAGVKDPSRKQIFLPSEDWNIPPGIKQSAQQTAMRIHGNWNSPRMTSYDGYGQRAHTRNVFQILGKDLISPSSLVICWTPGGEPVGGTRTAILLAQERNIPVFNLFHDERALLGIKEFLQDHKAVANKPLVYHCMKDPYPTYDVYVGRQDDRISVDIPGSGGKWGNPYPVSPTLPRGKSLEEYMKFIWTDYNLPLRNQMRIELAGKKLACWCAPKGGIAYDDDNLVCHGQVIGQIANSPLEQEF